MKISNRLSLLILVLIYFSCTSKESSEAMFDILPEPQSFEITGPSMLNVDDITSHFGMENISFPVKDGFLSGLNKGSESEAQVKFGIDKSINQKENAYQLEIKGNKISIIGNSEEGLFYGFMTLEQLIEDARDQNARLPECFISDYPNLSYRAIHLDVKHHMEKEEYYYKLISQLAKYKINGIIAEMEDKLAYKRQPIVGTHDAMTIEQWQALSEYAKDRFIEISPLIQGLGHASFILKHDEYKSLRDDPKSDWAFNPLDPKTYEVQYDLYLDAIEATPYGKYLHVGGDEVHTTGRESGKSALELQLSWLDKVCKFAEEQGRTPIFWDDMPLKHAGVYAPMFNTELGIEEVNKIWNDNEHKLLEFLDQFPKNCIYMRWNYSSPQAVGNQKSMEWFRKNGLQVMGATAGQTRWVLMPQNESNMDNIASFAKSSIEENLDGLLLTLWDDDSPHFELYKRGILSFADYTWNGSTAKEDLKTKYRHRFYGPELADPDFKFIDDLETPVFFWKDILLNQDRRNYLPQNKNAIEAVIDFPDPKNPGKWIKEHESKISLVDSLYSVCTNLTEVISKAKAKALRNQYTLEIYEMVNEMCKFSFNAFLMLRDLDQASQAEDRNIAIQNLGKLDKAFELLRSKFEAKYGEVRILEKGDNYIIDQDHHRHLANQTQNFDWQLYAEMLFIKKVITELFENENAI